MDYRYTPHVGTLGSIDPVTRREVLTIAHDALPVMDRERLDGMVEVLSKRYDNVGRLIALEVLAAIGIGLEKEGYGDTISVPAI